MVILAAVLVGALPVDWWISDLLANARLHLFVAALLLVPFCRQIGALRQGWLLAGIGIGGLVLSLGGVELRRHSAPADSNVLRITTFNLHAAQADADKTTRYLEDQDVDVIVLLEIASRWQREARTLTSRYPYSIVDTRNGVFGISIFSRHPLTERQTLTFPESDIPFIRVQVDFHGIPVTVYGARVTWPVTPSSYSVRNKQLEHLEAILNETEGPLILCGDFNLTPHSVHYRRFLSGAQVTDIDDLRRYAGSWPSALSVLGIPIDHCFARSPYLVEAKHIGPWLGSDHRPATFSIALVDEVDRDSP